MHKFKYINSESSLDSDAEDYFGFPNKNNSIETSKSMSIEGQVLAYLNNKSHSLQSLEKYPIIKTLIMRYNTTIPSSAPVERLFSLVGITLTPKRSKLSDKTLEMLVLLRAKGKHQWLQIIFFNYVTNGNYTCLRLLFLKRK